MMLKKTAYDRNYFNYKNLKIMARAMFEYTKTVLEKVSFHPTLFCKELQKALDRLLPFEIDELHIWLKQLTLQNPELREYIPLLKS